MIMNIEKLDPIENIDKDLDKNLDKAFNSDDFEWIDTKFKWDIEDIFANSSIRLDPENPTDSLKLAMDQNMTNMIDKNLKNLWPTDKRELKDIQKRALKSWNLNNMMESYSEMKRTLWTLNWKMWAKAQVDQQIYQDLQETYSKEQLEFLQKLAEYRDKNEKLAEKRISDMREKQAKLKAQENVEKIDIENNLEDMLKHI